MNVIERWFPIETEGLLLREFTLADEMDVHEFASDPLVPRYDNWGPNTPDETHEFLSRKMAEQQNWPRNDVTLAADLRHERKVIGSVRLWIVDEANRIGEIGYTFNRRYWNNGYATEAASALLGRAILALNMHRVIATCDTRNVGSWHVMEKIGMRREGHFLRDKLQKGEWRDTYLYAILAEEWLEHPPRP
ncbi:MAG: GNAT family N-acetyltransferase [Vulcanimicrobiaceae bacterium]